MAAVVLFVNKMLDYVKYSHFCSRLIFHFSIVSLTKKAPTLSPQDAYWTGIIVEPQSSEHERTSFRFPLYKCVCFFAQDTFPS